MVFERSNWLSVRDVSRDSGLRESVLWHGGTLRSTLDTKLGNINIIDLPGFKTESLSLHIHNAFKKYERRVQDHDMEGEGEWLMNSEAVSLLGASIHYFYRLANTGRIPREKVSVPPGYKQGKLWLYWIPGVERVMYPDNTLRFIIHPNLSLDGRLRSVVYDLDAILPDI
jgi:hypothetical protein